MYFVITYCFAFLFLIGLTHFFHRAFGEEVDNFLRSHVQKSKFDGLLNLLVPNKVTSSSLFVQSGLFRFGLETIITTCLILHISGHDCKNARLEKWCYPVCLRIRRRRAVEMVSESKSKNVDKSAINDLTGYYNNEQEEAEMLNDLIRQTEDEFTFEKMNELIESDSNSSELSSSSEHARGMC